MCNPLQIKVCVIVDNVENLYSINKNDSLSKVVQDLCNQFNKINDHLFGLQICIDEAKKRYAYVTEQNFNKIIHGSVLKLVPSIDYMIRMIFDPTKYSWKTRTDWLKSFSDDIAFVSKLEEDHLITLITKIERKSFSEDLHDALLALSNILDNVKFNFVTEHFVEYLINFINQSTAIPDIFSTIVVLKILGQVMIKYEHYHSTIYAKLKISDLMPYLWNKDYCDMQLYTLIIINNYVKFSGKDMPLYIKEISTDQNKKFIFDNVIKNVNNFVNNDWIAHELYIYQTFILSTYNEFIKNLVNLGENQVPHTPKLYIFHNRESIDFEEVKMKSINSPLDVSETDGSESAVLRSLNNTVKMNRSYRVISSSSDSSIELRQPRQVSELLPADVMELTRICLDYYKDHYKKNYSLSILESNHPPGFHTVANDVCKIICKILDIGQAPDTTSTLFHPLVFACDKKSFVEELFCRALWLLARTRREMKARTAEDHEKVLPVLECQIRMALHTKPLEYKILTETLKKYTHEKVYDEWEKEREQTWNDLLLKHPDMKELRKKFEQENTLLIKEQRLSILRNGAIFPKIVDKVTKGRRQYWHLRLKKHTLIYEDCLEDGRISKNDADAIEITAEDIMHVVSGVVCPHVKDHRIKKSDMYSQCFSILLNQNEGSLDFLGEDEEAANKWVDGLNVFVGKPMSSATYQKELDDLVTMDMNLYLLELQGVPIPLETPIETPSPPIEYRIKPPKPPKPSREVLARKTVITVDF